MSPEEFEKELFDGSCATCDRCEAGVKEAVKAGTPCFDPAYPGRSHCFDYSEA